MQNASSSLHPYASRLKKIKVSKTASFNYVLLTNLSPETNQDSVKNLLQFCGDIVDIEIIPDTDESIAAVIEFKDPQAGRSAFFVNQTKFHGRDIVVSYLHGSEHEQTASSSGSTASRTAKSLLVDILATGYQIGDVVYGKAKEYDDKLEISKRASEISTKATTTVSALAHVVDSSLHVSETAAAVQSQIGKAATSIDEKLKIQDKYQQVVNIGQQALDNEAAKSVKGLVENTMTQIKEINDESKKIARASSPNPLEVLRNAPVIPPTVPTPVAYEEPPAKPKPHAPTQPVSRISKVDKKQ